MPLAAAVEALSRVTASADVPKEDTEQVLQVGVGDNDVIGNCLYVIQLQNQKNKSTIIN